MVIKIEMRNYGAEFAMWDRVRAHGVHHFYEIEELLNKDAEGWMSADNPFPWREKCNAGKVCGLVFDSNLDITVKDSNGNELDHFKGSDCFDLTYTYREYSAMPIRRWQGDISGGRITGMEVSKEGCMCCTISLPFNHYARGNIHLGLSKVKNLCTRDAAGGFLLYADAFVIDSYFLAPYDTQLYKPINLYTDSFTLNGPKYQRSFVSAYSLSPPRLYKEANQKDCDSFYNYFIITGEFK